MNYKIAAYDVDFPHKAYGVQLGFMEKVLKALDSKSNALLEAPTGSGKTLSLLCAALAWQRQQKIDIAKGESEFDVKAEPGSEVDEPQEGSAADSLYPEAKQKQKKRCTRIYYATRTHSQIAQVVRELKRTSYRPKMAILASREHYCIHPTVSKKANKDEECQNMLKDDPGCKFFKNVNKLYSMQSSHFLMVHDIEDLAKVGRDHKACPYYAATHFAGEADLVFCPYSYLLDPVIRSAMDITLDESVLIFDEAHNIEDTARDAASAELELDQLQEVQLAFQKMDVYSGAPGSVYQSLAEAMAWLLTWLKDKADGGALPSKGYERYEGVWAGHQALAELSEAGLSEEKVEVLWDLYSEARQAQEDRSGAGGGAGAQGGVRPAAATQATQGSGRVGMFALGVLSRLLTVLRLMYSAGAHHVHDYRLAVQKWVRHADRQPIRGRGRRSVEDDDERSVSGWVVQLCLWSLNPAVAFKELTDKARCVVLTSGTLAPTDSFASELGASFPVKLEAPHVVDVRKQVWAGAIGRGADGATLQATYKQADTTAFQDSVGKSVVEVCRVVPDGVLMFLPSYSMLDRLVTRWKTNGLWGQLAALKRVVIEPKGTGEAFDTVMKDYYTAVKRGQGGLFMAVCRGKVSEGLDFADSNARAVLIFGIPFPNVKDTKVGLKKAYNDAGQRTHRLLSGDQWYSQQAFRALNQAIGRCIRHRADYGAIMLFDDRFRQPRYQKNLSRWVRGTITVQPSFDTALDSITQFFARLKADPPAGSLPTPPPST
ncbi:hypothetical protein WJX77_006278 [Trebouxia sp. C0004]